MVKLIHISCSLVYKAGKKSDAIWTGMEGYLEAETRLTIFIFFVTR